MISLITGLPGAGKTSLMVHMLMTRKDLHNRPLFVDGIPDLKVPHETCPEGNDMTTWHQWAPSGSILVIDEAQRVFRPRPSGSKVPDYIQALETHRHKGIDIFIMTQHPRLIDVNLRSLIGEHRHISKTLIGLRRVMYWQRCANPEAKRDVAEGKASIFTPKRKAFGMYKSAEQHTKIGGSLSLGVYVVPFIIASVIAGIWFLNARITSHTNPDQPIAAASAVSPAGAAEATALADPTDASSGRYPIETASQPDKTKNAKPDDYIPVIPGRPETKPLYDNIRTVQSMEWPAACVLNHAKKRCTCYTDQGSVLPEIGFATCADYANNGKFNPYRGQSQSPAPSVPPPVNPS